MSYQLNGFLFFLYIKVRTSGFALAYSLATAIFGGFTPAVSTFLIHASGNPAMPGIWLSLAGLFGLVGAVVTRSDSASSVSTEIA